MFPTTQIKKILPPVILFTSLMVIYLFTIAPGLTWANSGADGGDLIAAAATGGVAHPSGYPLYLFLASLFQKIPIGTLAFRTNLMSAIATALAAVIVYMTTTRSLSPARPFTPWLAGLTGGFAFGLAPLVWSQAVITEVYALNALSVALILYLSESSVTTRFTQSSKDGLLGLIFGLSMGNHITILFLLPVILLTKVHRNSNTSGKVMWKHRKLDIRSFPRLCLWIGIGLLIYLTLPLRALSKPPVNWGYPSTPGRLWWLVSGKLYQEQLTASSLSMIWERLRAIAAIFLDHFGLVGLTVGLAGLIIFFKSTRLKFSTIWIAGAFSAFAIIYGTQDAFMYLIPAVLCFAIWIGFGSGKLMETIPGRFRGMPVAAGSILLLVLFIQAGLHWKQVDAASDTRAESFSQDVLSIAPPDAIVFAQGDQAIFSLWYYQYSLHSRPDLDIIAPDLLQFDWYTRVLKDTYPSLIIPTPFPFASTVIEANPGYPYCYVQYDQIPLISCSPAGKPAALSRP
jgi:hypothetical protein